MPASRNAFRLPLFWRFAGLISNRRNAAVALCVVVASLADGFGIATLLPLISVLDESAAKASPMSQQILGVLKSLNIPAQPVYLLGIVVAGVLTKAALMIVALRQIGTAVADVGAKLRINLVDALLQARWGFYVRQPVGRFANALGTQATLSGEAYNATMQLLSQSVQAAIYLLVAALVSWQLALFTLVTSAVMLGSLHRFLLAAKRSAKTQQNLMVTVLARLTDVLVGIKPMKAMSRQARFAVLFERDLHDVRQATRRQVLSRNINKSLQEPILAICLALGIFTALKVLQLPIGEVIVMSLLLAKTVLVVGKAQQELQNLYATEHGLKLIRGVIDETVEARERMDAGSEPVLSQGIEFREVSFGYDQRLTLDHLDLKLAVGELVALTGPSGTGKTTLIDVLLGFHQPQSGAVLVDGTPLTAIDLAHWRALIGYVPQELMLFHDSIAANVTLGEARFTEADVQRALQDAGALDFVSRLPDGIATVVGERGAALSGGQRQRIALARALIHQPKLLILDEATSALDPTTEQLIIGNVVRLVQERGLTVLSVTHHRAWLDAATRVVALQPKTISPIEA